MAIAVLMPKQGQSVESCLIIKWNKKVGDKVKAEEPICEVETDKAVFEVEAPEAGTMLKIFYKEGDDILLVHGHQGDRVCDKYIWLSSFISRCLKSVVPFAKAFFNYENRSATKSQIPKSREKLYYNWAKENKAILICGHTHNAIFASRSYYWWLKEQIEIKEKELEKKQCSKDKFKINKLSKKIEKQKSELLDEERRGRKYNRITAKGEEPLPCYFNTGCGLYRTGITNIEIEGDKIRLIKWKRNNSLLIEKRRKVLWKEESLSELRKELHLKPI